MNKKKISILILAIVVLIGTLSFVMEKNKQKKSDSAPLEELMAGNRNGIAPEKNIPQDNITIDQMTKEQADFAKEFMAKTSQEK